MSTESPIASNGTILSVIGAVVDVLFPQGSLPKIHDALKVEETGLVLETQGQIGDGVVRTIAMGSSDGLRRSMKVSNSGKPIQVPVGTKMLGRIVNVLGKPIDDAGDIGAEEHWSIHRPAPSYADQGERHRAARDRHQSH